MNDGAVPVNNKVAALGTVLTSYTETDPTVPAWAKAASKPSYTASEVGALPTGTTLDNISDGTTRKLSNYSLTSHTHSQYAAQTDFTAHTGNTTIHMTSDEKTKLAGIAAGAEVNVQANWTETATTSDAFIKNKPTIPTKVSELANDSNYLTTETQLSKTSTGGGNAVTDITVSNHAITLTKGETFATNSDLITHTGNTTVHITAAERTAWNSKLVQDDIAGFFDSVEYDSTNKRINFKHGTTVKGTVDATAFIKDGMVDNVAIETPTGGTYANQACLVVTFNSVSGKQPIYIPLTQIFNPNNYYDKTTADSTFVKQVSGKGLSTNDYTTTEKNKLAGIAAGAEVNVNADWNATSGDAQILNKPTIPSAPGTLTTTATTAQSTATNEALSGNIQLHKVAKTGSYNDLNNKPTIPQGTVTSVGITNGGGINVAGSPITTSGNITITADGSAIINNLGEGTSPAERGDYIVAQYAGGGTTTTSYHRRKLSNVFAALNSTDVTNALGYTPYNATNPNGYTSNQGTVTGIKMNGASKGTSGVVDLGTVITGETDPTVPAWAKAASKPSYTASEVGAASQANFTAHTASTTVHVTSTEKSTWNGKQDAISDLATIRSNAAAGANKVSNVQSDWNATSGLAQILNKPTIPTVNNGTLTIQQNGTTVGTFTANQAGSTTANISINGLPNVSSSDNNKILLVQNGAWAVASPTMIYTGSGTPASTLGNEGDIYLQM